MTAGGWTWLDRASECLDEPGVERQAARRRGRFEPGLQAVGQAQRDPGGRRLVGRLGLHGRRLLDVDEFGVTAGDADLDPALFELSGELECRFGKRLLQASAQR